MVIGDRPCCRLQWEWYVEAQQEPGWHFWCQSVSNSCFRLHHCFTVAVVFVVIVVHHKYWLPRVSLSLAAEIAAGVRGNVAAGIGGSQCGCGRRRQCGSGCRWQWVEGVGANAAVGVGGRRCRRKYSSGHRRQWASEAMRSGHLCQCGAGICVNAAAGAGGSAASASEAVRHRLRKQCGVNRLRRQCGSRHRLRRQCGSEVSVNAAAGICVNAGAGIGGNTGAGVGGSVQ